jgi:hypothetical protein
MRADIKLPPVLDPHTSRAICIRSRESAHEQLEKRINTMENPTHIGDGVYVYFDGFGFELRVNDHRNPMAVYLEPSVLDALNRFAGLVKQQPK